MTKQSLFRGFTLLEIVITVIVIGVIAGIAYPRYMVTVEKMRAAEGVNTLMTLLAAQKRYAMENEGAYCDGGSCSLDVDIPVSTIFDAPSMSNDPGSLAQVQRIPAQYKLYISENGDIGCTAGALNICSQLGY